MLFHILMVKMGVTRVFNHHRFLAIFHFHHRFFRFFQWFLVADTHFYKRLCWSVGPLVMLMLKIWKCAFMMIQFWMLVCVSIGLERVWMGVACPCPPIHKDIVTPRHLLYCSIPHQLLAKIDPPYILVLSWRTVILFWGKIDIKQKKSKVFFTWRHCSAAQCKKKFSDRDDARSFWIQIWLFKKINGFIRDSMI